MAGHSESIEKSNNRKNGEKLTIALAGNANVGKSVIFNQLTGSNQIIGNWPGKTVDRAEGSLCFENYEISVIDLPGIYSFSTFSLEEVVSREYIAKEKPDVVINVLDASVLERNLFFTLQLIEMNAPLVLCLNQIDIAKKKGMIIDKQKLEKALGVPVVLTIATRGEGLYELIESAVKVATENTKRKKINYHNDLEIRIEKLTQLIKTEKIDLEYPSRWIAIKLLEGDTEIVKLVKSKSAKIVDISYILSQELSTIHDEPCFSIVASERYAYASMITSSAMKQNEVKNTFSEKLDWVTTHKVFGYFIAIGVITGLLLWTFIVGDFLSGLISEGLSFIEPLDPQVSGPIVSVIWNGVFNGFVAGVTLVIPFVIPFYFLLAMIEDSGILTRVAFMMDSVMHKIGLHGKALIPLILGYGCSVPAIHSCKIMESRRERLLAAFAITFVPCAARTLVILGLVGVFLGPIWALTLYAVDLILIFLLGRIAMKVVPGKSTGLIMEMHSFKVPSLSVVSKQTWTRTKSIIFMVFPIYIIGSAIVQALYALDLLTPISNAMSPLTVTWLGLPAITGILLILGVVRKEFILLGAVAVFGTTNLLGPFNPVQLITLALVAMLYIPCLSTIIILIKEFGWKAATTISIANIISAIIIGGLAYRLLEIIL
ncbi:ferrous iron transport protein B [Candidatus Bathyarchaeota archaeon]|nr:ferrous iron transport protein B [Candidatus Bathyarchaeota archaeon]